MKKLMVAVLALVVLSGCASNGRYQMAQDIGATVAGAVVGNRVARMTGASNGTLGGVVGAVVAHQVFLGSQEARKTNSQNGWWECKPGFGQVWKTRNGKDVPACEKGAPQIARPVAQQQVVQQQIDPLVAESYYRGRQRAYDRQRRERARAALAQGCWDEGGC